MSVAMGMGAYEGTFVLSVQDCYEAEASAEKENDVSRCLVEKAICMAVRED